MSKIAWSAALLAVLASVLTVSAAAGPTDPPYPSRIDFPAPTVDPTTGAVTTNFAPEGMAVSGDTFYAGSTATGEIIKGNLKTGAYQRDWVPASPNQPSDLHRGILGLLVDDHNRVWAASSVGMACGGNNQPACPAGSPSPQVNYGAIFVYDGTTGAELAQYTVTNLAGKLMNDFTIASNRLVIANTTAPACNPPVPPATTPTSTNCETQFEIPLGPGGALPPGDTPPPGNTGASVACGTKLCPAYANPAVIALPTPGFGLADGIDTLPNGHVVITSVSGTPVTGGQMINLDPVTGAYSYITVTAADRPGGAPPLLSLDGVTLDGNMLYAPENRLDAPPPTGNDTSHCPAPFTALSCPGDWAAIHLDPPDYTTGEVLARLNSPPGSGLPPLRSPANMEQLGHSLYGITRVVLPNPVTGATNVTQTFIERLDKLPLTATGSPVAGAVEGAAFSGTVATFSDPNSGPIAANSYPQQGSSAYGYTASIDWGDGSTSTGTVAPVSGGFAVSGSHTYAEENSYTVKTTVVDGSPSAAPLVTATSPATVGDAAITAAGTTISGVEGSPVSGTVATLHDANPLGSASDFTVTIDWGDGTPATNGTLTSLGGGNYAVGGTHTYASAVPGGTFDVTVSIVDDGGSHATANTTANIAYAPGCLNAGDVHADAHFLMPGSKPDVHFELDAKCKTHDHDSSVELDHAHAKVSRGGDKIVDAKTDGHSAEITTVKITGSTAVIVGTDGGSSFVIVVTDGGKGKNAVDTASIVVKDSGGNVVFDSSTLSAKHDPHVEIKQK